MQNSAEARRVDTLVITDPSMTEHDIGPGHPEQPERLRAILAQLDAAALLNVERRPTRAQATRADLTRIHREDYVHLIHALRGRTARLDHDTAVCPGTVDAALTSAGGVIDAVNAVCAGEAGNAFAIGRPPGHHAEANRAMGFCFFNNVAVAAQHALDNGLAERVMIIDWDVHHGNGAQNLFWDRRDVMVVNAHRYPFYPGTGALEEVGEGDGAGYTVNVPLPGGLGDGDYAHVFRAVIEPLADGFSPDLVLISAGFDAHRDDPLADQRVSHEGFAHLCGIVKDIAHRYANDRLVLTLEGGYDVGGLARSVRACVEVLAGATPGTAGDPSPRGAHAVEDAREITHRHWKQV